MSYQSLANELKINNQSIITRWVIDFREKGVEGLNQKKRGRSSNIVKDEPYTQITTDTTEIKYLEKDTSGNYQVKKVYLNPYLDMFNSEIISYEISKEPTLTPIIKALEGAIKVTSVNKGKSIFHSDQVSKTIYINIRRKKNNSIHVKKGKLFR